MGSRERKQTRKVKNSEKMSSTKVEFRQSMIEVYFKRRESEVRGVVEGLELHHDRKSHLDFRFLTSIRRFRTSGLSTFNSWRVCMSTRWVNIVSNSFVSPFGVDVPLKG